MPNHINLAQGVLLISEPFCLDGFFKRSVVLVVEHDDNGTLGFILNKPTEVKLNDAVEDFPVFDAPLYLGGPVETDTLFYVHTLGDTLSGSKLIKDGLWWGGDYDQLMLLVETKQITQDQIRFFAGYGEWSPVDMADEFEQKAWITCLQEIKELFSWKEEKMKDMWGNVLRRMGGEYAILANFPEDPNLN